MRIEAYNFFFDPWHESHSCQKKILAVITAVALTAISCGVYLLVFGLVRCLNRPIKDTKIQPVPSPQERGSLEELKAKQKQHLAKLQALVTKGEWEHLQTHTAHPDSGFDWWMFPIDRPSRSFGNKYMVNWKQVETLKNDPEFMRSYREGVVLVAKSWGWDLENSVDLTNRKQKWVGYNVRLHKMEHSLQLFNQRDLSQTLSYFKQQYVK